MDIILLVITYIACITGISVVSFYGYSNMLRLHTYRLEMSITVMPVIERSRMPNSMIYTSVSMKNVELKIVIMLRHLSLLNFTITW